MEYLWPPAWLVAVGAPATRLPASGNQEERSSMLKRENRRGFALGAIFALVVSLFSAVPAQAAGTLEIRLEEGTSFTGLLTDDLNMYAHYSDQTGVEWAEGRVLWEVTKTAGAMDVTFRASRANSGSAVAAAHTLTASAVPAASANKVLAAATAPTTLSASVSSTVGTVAGLSVRAVSVSPIVSSSPTVTVTVKVWIENGLYNGQWDAGETYATQTVTFLPTSAIAATMVMTDPNEGDETVTASATVTTDLNFEQLQGSFYLAMSASAAIYTGPVSVKAGTALSSSTVAARNGVVSQSFGVVSGLVTGSQTVTMALRYLLDSEFPDELTSIYLGNIIGAANAETVAGSAVNSLALSAVAGDNVTASATPYTVRPNTPITVRALTKTSSTTVSGQVVTFTITEAGMDWPTRYLTVAGATTVVTDSATIEVTATSDANGYASITITPTGFTNETFEVDAAVGNTSATQIALATTAPAYTVVNDYDLYKTGAGSSVTLGYKVIDQWNVLSTRTDQRLKLTRGGTGFNYATTVSYATVSGGKATFAFTPAPAAKTGSATVTSALQLFDADSNVFSANGTNDQAITVNVSALTDSVTGSAVLSRSVSVSYVADTGYTWTGTAVSGTVVNGGSSVVISSTGLVFEDVATSATASDTITVRSATDGTWQVKAAGEKSGTYTLTIVSGATTTTSIVVVDQPGSDQGTHFVWDTTEIAAGKTRIVTGTLVDTNSNPVYTDWYGSVDRDATTASIAVTYAGTAGIPVGTMPTETDVNGQFRVSILTSAADSGSFDLTAVYSPHGTVTATADKVTSVQSITVGESASSSDQKVNAGSFKGYVAVYAKGYEGSRLSAKIGNDWVVVESLASNFERVVDFTGAGYTIAVRIYIDRVLVDTITVTTK